MAQSVNVKNVGLRGVTVADTKVSFIDGDNGILLYRGYRIEQLAEESSFMEVAFLILHGYLPNKKKCQGLTWHFYLLLEYVFFLFGYRDRKFLHQLFYPFGYRFLPFFRIIIYSFA